jgi:outer membrane protein TolC
MKNSLALIAVATSALLTGSPGQAQDAAPYNPPLLQPGQKELRLLDAVRLALQNDPLILLRESESLGKGGVARELSGQFDTTLKGDAQYSYVEQELTETTKRQERKDRDDLINAQPAAEALADSLLAVQRNLQDPRLATDPDSVDLSVGVTDPATRIQVLGLQTQLALITDLINNAGNAGLRNSLINLRNQSLDLARTQVGRSAAEADRLRLEVRQILLDLGPAPVDEWKRNASVKLQLLKQLRNGLFIAPFVENTYRAGNYVGKTSDDPKKGGQGIKDTYRAEVGFDVRVPLFRGRGSVAVAAAERSARKDFEASRFSYLHEKSLSVLETTRAYWDVRAAWEQVEVAQRAVQLESGLLSTTQALIKAKEKPRSDEARVQASTADAQARLAQAQRSLNEARVNLARVMGVAIAGAEDAPLAADAFPEPAQNLATSAEALNALAIEALEHRLDRKAAALVEEAAFILVRGARRDVAPKIDLTGKFSGNSTAESRYSDLDRWIFRSATGGLEIEAPFANNTQRGRLAQREASWNTSRIDNTDLSRTIALNVLRTAQSLTIADDRLRQAEAAVRAYERTIEDEQAKLKAGDSTLVDTILTEQQTTAARSALVEARRDYARTLAELRFQIGLLVLESPEGTKVTEESLLGVPAALQGGPAPASR